MGSTRRPLGRDCSAKRGGSASTLVGTSEFATAGDLHLRMRPVVRATEDPPRSPPTSRHLTLPPTVGRELRRCWLACRSPPTRSHGGSQGFKSPHLHPHKALVTGLADGFRRAGAVPGSPSGQQTGSNRKRNGQPLLDCGQETERSGHVPDLPITRRTLGVDLDGLQTDRACSRWMARRFRRIETGPVGSPR